MKAILYVETRSWRVCIPFAMRKAEKIVYFCVKTNLNRLLSWKVLSSCVKVVVTLMTIAMRRLWLILMLLIKILKELPTFIAVIATCMVRVSVAGSNVQGRTSLSSFAFAVLVAPGVCLRRLIGRKDLFRLHGIIPKSTDTTKRWLPG